MFLFPRTESAWQFKSLEEHMTQYTFNYEFTYGFYSIIQYYFSANRLKPPDKFPRLGRPLI